MRKTTFLNFLIFAYIICGLIFSKVWAAESEVVNVKRNITLSDSDKIYKDFYINTGDSSVFKKNLVVKALRKVTIKNPGQKVIGDFYTVVGLLKIIHVEGGVAVARELSLLSRDSEPMIDQVGIMIGDQIDLKDSYIDNKK